MRIEELLSELGRQTGLGPLSVNEHRVCRLLFDNRLTVDIEVLADNQRFFIHSVVGHVPLEDREAVFAELLSANLFGQQTGGACLALDRNQDEILLFKEFLADETDYAKLTAALEVFLNRLEYWKSWLLAGAFGQPPTETPMPSNSFIRA